MEISQIIDEYPMEISQIIDEYPRYNFSM